MSILVIDDDWLPRGGVVKALEALRPNDSIFECDSLVAAFEILGQALTINLVILDLNLEQSQGIQTLIRLKEWCVQNASTPRIVVLSGAGHEDPDLVIQIIENYGTGFILKGTAEKVFGHALALTLDGGVYIPEEALRGVGRQTRSELSADRNLKLTPLEQDICACLIRGLTYKEVAVVLEGSRKRRLAESTVRAHVNTIGWKMGVERNVKAGVVAEIARRGLTFRSDLFS